MEPVNIEMTNTAVSIAPIAFFLIFFLVGIAIPILMAWVYCRIFAKTGFCWALGLLMLVPIANIVMPFVLAFSEWPIERKLKESQQHQQQNRF